MARKQTIVFIRNGNVYRMAPKHLAKYASDQILGNALDWTTYAEFLGPAIVIPDTDDNQTAMMRMTQAMNIKDLR